MGTKGLDGISNGVNEMHIISKMGMGNKCDEVWSVKKHINLNLISDKNITRNLFYFILFL